MGSGATLEMLESISRSFLKLPQPHKSHRHGGSPAMLTLSYVDQVTVESWGNQG